MIKKLSKIFEGVKFNYLVVMAKKENNSTYIEPYGCDTLIEVLKLIHKESKDFSYIDIKRNKK